MIPIVDLFLSIQGEGQYSGVPSIFIRVSGCNLRCVFKNSICDTAYTSFTPEKNKYSEDDIVTFCKNNSHISHIVITGGEPLLYKDQLLSLMKRICDARPSNSNIFTIETNGTLPSFDFIEFHHLSNKYNVPELFYSISPKLSTSVDFEHKYISKELANKHNNTRINIDSIVQLITNANGFQLKFVYSGEECLTEIKQIIDEIAARGYNVHNHVMLMPEGQFENDIKSSAKNIVDVCIKEGWRFSHRLHILIWGDKRCV